MRVVITFLGTVARPTKYQHQAKVYDGDVFAQALQQFCEFDLMLVCVTKGVTESGSLTAPILEKLEGDNRIRRLEIPTGETTDEIWEIFNKITEQIQPKDVVTFDITHGLRSLPFLVFLFAAYLKAAKEVSIDAIYYGAAELRRNSTAPVIDLSEFISLLDWTAATNQFIKTGDGQSLAKLLEEKGDIPAEELAKGIGAISLGLHLLRPSTVMAEAAKLPKLIQEASPTLSQSVPPFATLLGKVQEDYTAFGLENPTNYKDKLNAQAALVCQLKMIDWYAKKGQIVHALSMAREWLPSLLCWQLKLDPFSKDDRGAMESLLWENDVDPYYSDYARRWKKNPDAITKPVAKIWQEGLTDLRNDVLHSGFRRHPKETAKILEKVEQIVTELHQIAATFRLE